MLFLVKLTIAWGVLALFYTLLLRRETFFRANRMFLLGALLLGLGLALVENLPVWWQWASIGQSDNATTFWVNPVLTISAKQANMVLYTSTYADVVVWIWFLGSLFAAARLGYGLFSLYRLGRSGRQTPLPNGLWQISSPDITMPCSFFRWVFVPAKTPVSEAVLAHECAHAHARHSFDVLLLECLAVLFWFHPLVYWYRRALRTLHEYEADAAAARLTTKKQYGLLLIGQAQSGMSLAFVNHFFQSPLKQRLFMLTKKTSSERHIWKYALVVPVLAVVLTLCQTTLLVAQNQKDKEAKELLEVQTLPEFPGGMQAMMAFLSENIQYPAEARKAKAEGRAAVSFVVDQDGAITEVKAVEGTSFRSDFLEEAVRVVKKMPKWSPALSDGKPVKCRYTLPIKFKLD